MQIKEAGLSRITGRNKVPGLCELMENPDSSMLVMIKNNNGTFTPVTREPEAVPEKKEPLSRAKSIFMRKAEVKKYNDAVEENKKSREAAEIKNKAIEKYNETARVYARALAGQVLKAEEVKIFDEAIKVQNVHSASNRLEFPNAEPYNAQNAAPAVVQRGLDHLSSSVSAVNTTPDDLMSQAKQIERTANTANARPALSEEELSSITKRYVKEVDEELYTAMHLKDINAQKELAIRRMESLQE